MVTEGEKVCRDATMRYSRACHSRTGICYGMSPPLLGIEVSSIGREAFSSLPVSFHLIGEQRRDI